MVMVTLWYARQVFVCHTRRAKISVVVSFNTSRNKARGKCESIVVVHGYLAGSYPIDPTMGRIPRIMSGRYVGACNRQQPGQGTLSPCPPSSRCALRRGWHVFHRPDEACLGPFLVLLTSSPCETVSLAKKVEKQSSTLQDLVGTPRVVMAVG